MSKKFLSPIKLAQGATNPATGSSGELFFNTVDLKVYAHNGTAWLPSGGGVTVSDTAPTSPATGDAWYNSLEGTLFVYYDSFWVEASNNVNNAEPNSIPAGSIMAWGSNIAPSNWLICNGSAVSRSTYASLFASISTTYGSGDGSTTFNLPDLRGRVPVGKDASTFGSLGATGGAETHSHGNGSLAAGGTFFTAGGGVYFDYNTKTTESYVENVRTYWPTNGSVGALSPEGSSSGIAVYGSTSTSSSLQPYQVVNYIIKYSAGETPGDSQLATRVSAVEVANNATPLGPNYLLNADFFINQRAVTSTTTDSGYVFDRWKMNTAGGTSTYSSQTFSPGNAIPGYEPVNYARLVSTGQTTSGNFTMLRQIIEDVRNLAGQTATLSFWAKVASGTPKMALELEQNFGQGGSPSAAVTTYGGQVTLSTSWARYSLTVAIPSISGKTIGTTANTSNVLCSLFVSAGADWNARTGSLGIQSNTFDIWGVQLEAGSYATPFRRNQPNIQAELAACQRYYIKFTGGSPYGNIGTGFTYGGANTLIIVPLPVEMRVAPVSVEYSTLRVYDSSVAVSVTGVALSGNFNTNKQAGLTVDGGSVTANRPAMLQGNNNINYYLGLSAEL